MLAILGGFLALALGLAVLLLPLLVTELSRPRDSVWGAVVLLLGLVLVTSAERLTGAPMLAVLCAGLLIGRLGTEVGQARWRALSDEERRALLSSERWTRSVLQLGASAASLLEAAAGAASALAAWQAQRSQGRAKGKRWVRAEAGEPPAGDSAPDQPLPTAEATPQVRPGEAGTGPDQAEPAAGGGGEVAAGDGEVPVVEDFRGIDALLAAAEPAAPSGSREPPPAAAEPPLEVGGLPPEPGA